MGVYKGRPGYGSMDMSMLEVLWEGLQPVLPAEQRANKMRQGLTIMMICLPGRLRAQGYQMLSDHATI
jgi:hypothetical protein